MARVFVMYEELDSNPDFPKMENGVLDFWEKEKILSRLKELRRGSEERVYYDGPITANGLPHYGHAITWTLKDIIPRYWSMKGYLVKRNMGWDCQGIPVEYEVEKDLKFVRKEDIEKFGIAKFNELCRKSVLKYRDAIFHYEGLLGRWFDPAEIYSTMDRNYIESIWWSLKILFDKGLLYEGYKVVAYSTRAGCSLSTHEVSEGGYSDVEDPYVTVKFKLKGETDTYLLAWTTTPWTIPGNLMLAVGPNVSYSKILTGDEYLVVATERVKEVLKSRKYKEVSVLKPKDLVGKEYEQPFDLFEYKRKEGCFRVISSPHANTEEGTGIVHLAPYGAEDFEIFMGLGIKLFDYLDETANFTDLVPKYKGLFYKEANSLIVKDLEGANALFDFGTLVHRMPMCWRTHTPLIYKPVKSWYIAVTSVKDKMVSENQKVNWSPGHLKDGNSGIWIKNARDWALSRSRYWGTPLPIWINDKTSEKVCIGSFEELEKLSGVKVSDPHKPFVDEVVWEDKTNGGTFRRVKDVIDVWYDSAAMPFARLHYPFENKELFKKLMPAEYVSEGPDQVRLWFYVMHVLGVSLFGEIPYKNVVTIGMMLDETGKKMSKSKRNYKPMDDVLAEYGGDVLRLFILSSPIVKGEDAIFGEEALKGVRRDFFLPFWNSLKFFITYANLSNFEYQESKAINPTNILDKWVLARLNETICNVDSLLSSYQVLEATRQLQYFLNDLSTWYIRRSRDRIKQSDSDAMSTLYRVLSSFTLVMAPFLPFLSEVAFRILNMGNVVGCESVHLANFPGPMETETSEVLANMSSVREIVEAGHSLRKTLGIKVRQPLFSVTVRGFHGTKLTRKYLGLIEDELNVKEVKFVGADGKEISVEFDTNITEELKLEGLSRELVRSIQDLRKKLGLRVNELVEVEYPSDKLTKKAIERFGGEISKKALVKAFKEGESLRLIEKK